MSILKRIGSKLRDIDVWLNEKMGGKTGETISSRLGRYIEDRSRPARGWAARVLCRTVLLPLGLLLDNSWKHCRENINSKYKRH